MGLEKENALNAMLTQRINPSIYTRNQANMLMKEGKNIRITINT